MFAKLPKFVLFTGKGGVGKTTLACATAVQLADAGKAVLVVSTDPASNVAQVFETPVGNRLTPVAAVPGLTALEIDPEASASEYRRRVIEPLHGSLPEDEIAAISEQLSGACTTEISAFDEFTHLLGNDDLVARFDHIVFDTAPTGHTIRLLKLPGTWNRYLTENRGDASCLGPLAGLEKQRSRYAEAVDALADPDLTLLVLVARPRPAAIAEAERTSRELAGIGMHNQHLAINGLMPADDGGDPLALALADRDRAALAGLDPSIDWWGRSEFPLLPLNLVGIEALRAFADPGAHVVTGDTTPAGTLGHDLPALGALVDGLEAPGRGLIMLMGKGGVGKTTMAAAIAVDLASRGHPVHLTTTDPAANLAETLDDDLPGLTVSRIDPAAETARYAQHILETKGRDLDAEGRALLEEDLRSPCTEEIAVFQAFSRIIRESGRRFVVVDTAPTGHTLLLLDTTGAYHRDIMRHADLGPGRMVTPMMRLQDPEKTRVLMVTLAETTPVLEAARLQEDLGRAGIEPWGWIVNASLAAAGPGHPLLQARARAEIAEIEKIRNGLAGRLAVVPMLLEEPAGTERLRALASPARDTAAA
jgi:arsenite-transporting ATPase